MYYMLYGIVRYGISCLIDTMRGIMRYHKRTKSITSLKFRSILHERPKTGQFVLIAWDIRGNCGYCSIIWDIQSFECQHAVGWLPLRKNDVLTRLWGVAARARLRMPVLAWSEHYSHLNGTDYVSKTRLVKVARHEYSDQAPPPLLSSTESKQLSTSGSLTEC